MSQYSEWEQTIAEYKKQLVKLLEAPSSDFKGIKKKDIPDDRGVYAIFDRQQLLYIGQSKRLRGRLIDDHLQNDVKGSAFRRNVAGKFGLGTEKEITDFILANCSFKYCLADNPKLFEHFAISVLKPMLNRFD
jgi:hypothetical protein